MRNNPFELPESSVGRLVRQEQERAKLYRDLVGGGVIGEAIRQATAQEKLLRGLDFDRPYRGMLETLERDRKAREAMKFTVGSAWALTVADTARTIAFQNKDLFEHQRRLSTSVLETLRAIDLNRSAVGTALSAAKAQSQIREMIVGSIGQFSMFGAIAEQIRTLDAQTLRASDGAAETATALAAEMVLETQRIAEAIAAASTDAETEVLAGELLDAVVRFIAQLGPNTVGELRKMGLIQWFSLIIGVIGLYVALVPPQATQSAAEKASHAELSRRFDALQEEASAFFDAEARADDAHVANLRRAELNRDATFRRTPERSGEIVLRASAGTPIAIEKSQGRWRLVVFRDPLSTQLARAWVYATAVTELADPLDGTGK